jgi:hypothetical protein
VGEPRIIPTILRGIDGEPPTFVSALVAETAAAAIRYAQASGDLREDDILAFDAEKVLMRELDPIACKIMGVDHPWWVECTPRARNPLSFWRIDA